MPGKVYYSRLRSLAIHKLPIYICRKSFPRSMPIQASFVVGKVDRIWPF